jgi:hypothetical protein
MKKATLKILVLSLKEQNQEKKKNRGIAMS